MEDKPEATGKKTNTNALFEKPNSWTSLVTAARKCLKNSKGNPSSKVKTTRKSTSRLSSLAIKRRRLSFDHDKLSLNSEEKGKIRINIQK